MWKEEIVTYLAAIWRLYMVELRKNTKQISVNFFFIFISPCVIIIKYVLQYPAITHKFLCKRLFKSIKEL